MTAPSLTARALAILLGEWTTDGPAYVALADRIRLLLIDGRILPGTRLPAERELAERIGRSRTTVVAAYGSLRDSGHATSRRGSGTVVGLPPSAARRGPDPRESALVNFSMATPPAVPALPRYLDAAARRLPDHLGLNGVDYVGLQELRERIAARYAERGLPTEPEQIVVTSGAQHALALVAHALLTRGDRVLVEAPSYPHALEALRSAGGRLVSSPVTTETGWDAEHLLDAVERGRPAFAYLMTDFHNPTGATMPTALRGALLAAAVRAGTVLIVDETMAELDLDRGETPPIVAALATTPEERGSVILLGSMGKTLWSGLRLGWLRASKAQVDRIVAARPGIDLGVPIHSQLVAVAAVEDLATVLRQRREQLRASRDALAGLLAARVPEFGVPTVHGGLAFWTRLGAPVSSALALAARTQGLQITAGPLFGADGAFERFIRIPFTAPSERLPDAVDALAAAWASIAPLREADAAPLTQLA